MEDEDEADEGEASALADGADEIATNGVVHGN